MHGRQEGRFFHGYYDHYCFLPLYVFLWRSTAGELSAAQAGSMRPSMPGRFWRCWSNACAGLGLKCVSSFGAIAAFAVTTCSAGASATLWGYIVGIAKNDALLRCIREPMHWVEELAKRNRHEDAGILSVSLCRQHLEDASQVIAKLEVTDKGPNPRFIVTNLAG